MPNAAPIAVADAYDVHQGETLEIAADGVLLNDTDADQDSLSAELVSGPSNGSASFCSDGAFDYTPNSGFTGTDSFIYRVTDGTDFSNQVSVTIDVTNAAPAGAADSYDVHQGQTLNAAAAGVFANDSDADQDELTAEMVSGPSNGSLSLYSDGSFDYTPNSGFAGADSFVYRGYDGAEYTQEITVSIDVTNFAPVGAADSYDVHQGQTLNAAAAGVLANDSDADQDELTAEMVSGPSNGSLSLYSDGSFDYTPNSGFAGTDSFVYRGYDGAEYTGSIVVTIDVTNAAPVGSTESFSLLEGMTLAIAAPGVLANDDDADGDPLSAVVVANPSNGSLSLAADGAFAYTPNTEFFGTDTFIYKVYDGAHYSEDITVTIIVEADPGEGGLSAVNDYYYDSNFIVDLVSGDLTITAPSGLFRF